MLAELCSLEIYFPKTVHYYTDAFAGQARSLFGNFFFTTKPLARYLLTS